MAVELSWAPLSSKTTNDTASESAGRALPAGLARDLLGRPRPSCPSPYALLAF